VLLGDAGLETKVETKKASPPPGTHVHTYSSVRITDAGLAVAASSIPYSYCRYRASLNTRPDKHGNKAAIRL
jgi:hypothetical protein